MSVLFKQIQTNKESSSTSSSLTDSHQLSTADHLSHLDSLNFRNLTTPLSTAFSPAQLGVHLSQATVSDLKNKGNLHGEYAANLDSFCAASTEEWQLMTTAWTLKLLMKIDNATKTQSAAMSEKLQKDAREYVFLVLLSWKLSSYTINARRWYQGCSTRKRDCVAQGTWNINQREAHRQQVYIKKKIYDSLSPTSKHRNLALLTKAIIGQSHNVPLTVELYVCVAFLHSVAVAIKSQPTYLASKDRFWEEVDIALLDIRNAKDTKKITLMFIQLYQNDVNTFGAPENSELKTAPALAH
ncbi:hypothetical protein K435DRAFT_970820 [Dendrothele bispora CBS 962.96]|uniref:Uncharacterized protein n=1 Tax=Dendrothele bispora (strain CBS 962.96) TaxID=1314807 RepID=A0A4S8LA82_DENBC|nr:hypothetical protein K435DRAFT_970820 [Dendrothele bispora CBS 962.96]